jgi:hypothetical protein
MTGCLFYTNNKQAVLLIPDFNYEILYLVLFIILKSTTMTAAAKSIYYFGFYLYLTGLILMVAPNFLLSTLQLPETKEVWIRVLGVVVVTIGYYYHRSGAESNTLFLKNTIATRIFVFLSFAIFVLANYVSPVLIVFGVIDLAGALWTWMALKKGE